jgi:hypothetical protein
VAVHFPIPPEQRTIRAITDRAELPIRTVYLKAVGTALAEIHIPTLASALESGGVLSLADIRAVAHIDTLVGRLRVDMRPLLEQLLFRASSSGELIFAQSMGFTPIDIALFRQEAQQTARAMIGTLVQGIEQPQLLTIQDLIAESFVQSKTPIQVARSVADVVGLDDRRARALARYALELEAKGIPEKERLRLVEAERRRKLKSRGLAVGRTESTRCATKAQDFIWEKAISEGQMAEGDYEQEWVPSPNACPVCNGLRGARAPIGGRFREPGGEGPPNPHTHCRCGKRLRRPAA